MKSDEKRCPQCAETIKIDARVCKHCGHAFSESDIADLKAAEAKKRTHKALGFVGVFVAVVGIAAISGNHTTTTSAAPSDNASSTAAATPAVKWSYRTDTDKMRGGVEHYADIDSDNTTEFAFPYSGGSTLSLQLRKRKQDGTNAILTISHGQFMCHSFSRTQIAVKFDNGPVRHYGCTDTSDGTSNVIFLEGVKGFIANLKKSKTMMIEPEFFQSGSREFDFTTKGLDWKF